MRISDWSSDVCSSDLPGSVPPAMPELARHQGTIMAARGTLRLVRAQGEALARYAGRALWPAARASVGRDPAFDPETRSWFAGQLEHKIGRASCRERVGQYV